MTTMLKTVNLAALAIATLAITGLARTSAQADGFKHRAGRTVHVTKTIYTQPAFGRYRSRHPGRRRVARAAYRPHPRRHWRPAPPVHRPLKTVYVHRHRSPPRSAQTGGLLGGVVGATLGAVASNQIGKGSGRTAALIGGAILGAVVGNRVGRNLERSERAASQQVAGVQSVTPRLTEPEAARPNCREYKRWAWIDGYEEQITGIACQRPDGSWRDLN
jgi:surface antigen